MNEIIFITTRNILNTSGELRLVKNRTKVLYEKWGIVSHFIVISNKEKIKLNNEEIGSNSTIEKIETENFNPISIYLAMKKCEKKLLKNIKNKECKAVILSGIGTLSFVKFLKDYDVNIPVIADIHGAKEELLEFNDGNFLKMQYKRMLFLHVRYSERKYLKFFDGALVVSNALAENLNKEYNLNNFKHYIVPCAVDKNNHDLGLKRKYRHLYREKYNIKDTDIVIIYSGGASPWQCIEKSVDIYRNIKLSFGSNVKMMIFSHQIDKIKSMLKETEDIIFDNITANEVNKVLYAGDYALLIRDNFITNNVAYPNKFLEYVQSGMKIITTPFVYDIAKQVTKLNLGITIDFDEEYKEKLEEYIIEDIREDAHKDDWGRREDFLNANSFEETLFKFVEDFKLNI